MARAGAGAAVRGRRARCASARPRATLGSQPQQQPALEHPGRDLGGANRAEQDGVETAELVEHGVGKDLASGEIPTATEVVVGCGQPDAGGAHDLQRFGDHLGADAVSGDDADLVCHGDPVCAVEWLSGAK